MKIHSAIFVLQLVCRDDMKKRLRFSVVPLKERCSVAVPGYPIIRPTRKLHGNKENLAESGMCPRPHESANGFTL